MSKKNRKLSEKNERNPTDPAKLPPDLLVKLREALPESIVQAILGGCHEMDFITAADMLMQLSARMPIGVEPRFMQAHFRVREALLHLSDFDRTMREMEEEVTKREAGPGIVVANQAQAEAMTGGKLVQP